MATLVWNDLSFSDSNYSASKTSTSVSSGKTQFMATNTHIISISMYYHGTANDAQIADKRYLLVRDANFGKTVVIGDDISKISDVTFDRVWSTVVLSMGVEMSTSRDTTIGVVSELMDMEAMVALG